MASPWIAPTPQGEPLERPWMGMALLLSIPLLSLVLIRMLWSGSGIWFLVLGVLCLGGAAALFLARRNDPYARTLADEANRVPLVLMGVGALFLLLLALPNFAGGSDGGPAARLRDQTSGLTSEVSGVSQRRLPTSIPQSNSQALPQPENRSQVQLQPPVEEPVIDESSTIEDAPVVPEGSTTYIVEEGDTLWDIAERFGTTVDAILAANSLDNPADLQVGQELNIPPGEETAADDVAVEEETTLPEEVEETEPVAAE